MSDSIKPNGPGHYAAGLVFFGPGRSRWTQVGPLATRAALVQATQYWQAHRVFAYVVDAKGETLRDGEV